MWMLVLRTLTRSRFHPRLCKQSNGCRKLQGIAVRNVWPVPLWSQVLPLKPWWQQRGWSAAFVMRNVERSLDVRCQFQSPRMSMTRCTLICWWCKVLLKRDTSLCTSQILLRDIKWPEFCSRRPRRKLSTSWSNTGCRCWVPQGFWYVTMDESSRPMNSSSSWRAKGSTRSSPGSVPLGKTASQSAVAAH